MDMLPSYASELVFVSDSDPIEAFKNYVDNLQTRER